MTDRPILFSAPMIRALLDGRKTQTRRVINPQPDTTIIGQPCHPEPRGERKWVFIAHDDKPNYKFATADFLVPIAAGDRLWVRENCAAIELPDGTDVIRYPASNTDLVIHNTMEAAERWGVMNHYSNRRSATVPSIHMPRWASRLMLTVTDVRVQRLQEISEADAVAEGVIWSEPTAEDHEWAKRYADEHGGDPRIDGVWLAPGTRQGWGATKEDRDQMQWGPTAAFAFRCLWNSINGPEAWNTNPWVAAYTFTVQRGNIDRHEVLK